MLRIQDIRKKYVTGDLVQTALDGVSLDLRENEFVAILGPSGSGKTTLLNVIGGLDRYDSGDLIIDGVSTKQYTDRDWDSYRNHTVGFVFQSYNLIPHQTVLANVELALTISGISRSERRRRATIALQEVGLGNQLHKKPNQMSGGQMQRVAIARALVNNPSVLLADEPTGALDSETSIQVMELLKKVSKDRLVVMVTHNPELAYEYANRIVRVKDGQIIDDSNPLTVDEESLEPPVHRNLGKASMGFGSALALSFNNLRTKKARTLLTAFAGSIGIIGIALILSLSSGFQNYIDKIQQDTLANYPLTLQSETADMSAGMAMMGMGGGSGPKADAEPGTVEEIPMLSKMFANIGNNDLGAFKEHLENHMDEIGHTLNAVQYGYGINPRIFRDDPDQLLQVNPETLFTKLTGSSTMSAMMQMNSFQEMLDNPPLLDAQYQLLQGRWPEQYNELVFILPDETRVPDFAAYILGMKSLDGVDQMIQDVMNGKEVDFTQGLRTWTYDDLLSQRFKLVSSADLYQYNADYNVWEDMSGDETYMRALVDNGEPLQVVGIICPKEDAAASMMPGIGYLPSLTQHVMEQAKDEPIVKAQLENPDVDVFSGTPFHQDQEDPRELNFEDMIQVDADAISSAFGMDISQDEIMGLLNTYLGDALKSIQIDPTQAQADYLQTLSLLASRMLSDYVTANADDTGAATLVLSRAEDLVDSFLASDFARDTLSDLADRYGISSDPIEQATKPLLLGLVTGYIGQELADGLVPETPALPQLPDPVPEQPELTPPTLPPDVTLPDGTLPSLPPDAALPELPESPLPELPLDPDAIGATLTAQQIEPMVEEFVRHPITAGASGLLAGQMMQPEVERQLAGKIAVFGRVLASYLGKSFYVDEEQIAGAFHFNLNEAELRRLMEAMSGQAQERTAKSNLRQLGYAELSDPVSMAIYMTDFTGKEEFMQFLNDYNTDMVDSGHEEQEIHYMDMTGMMMNSVKTIIDSISYVLIAFVAVSLVVSSIMIGIITYISVMERTKEIGVLRAMGASKHNISQVFNAETYLIGLCSGLIGVGITLVLLVPINRIILNLTGNPDITAMLPLTGAVVLILLSVFLTVLGGLIPSKQAARKDPVIALRSE